MHDSIPPDLPQKQCRYCQEFLPVSITYFKASRYASDGFENACRVCVDLLGCMKRVHTYYPVDGMKRCTKCKEWKPATKQFFSAHPITKDGLRGNCKVCNKAYDNARSSIQAEKLQQRKQRNPELYRERQRKSDQKQLQLHGKEIRERKKLYYAKHPEQRRVEAHRRRVREKAVGGKYTRHDITSQYKAQKGRCYYCHCNLNNIYDVDHIIPISRGGTNTRDNIVIACSPCNGSKSDKLMHEWIQSGRLF